MAAERLADQVRFILEIDRLKCVFRQTVLLDRSRRENDAEHSWHLALMAVVLAEHAREPVDVGRVVRMVLVHDLVEIDAGDTFCYDEEGARDKAEREERAAERVFGLLPADQAGEFRALWDEFEAMETPEAKFAAALDRFQPLLHNAYTRGMAWRKHWVTADQVTARNAHIADGAPALWDLAQRLIRDAVAQGHLAPARPARTGTSGSS
jgi:putative hydrolase of HD superfamily